MRIVFEICLGLLYVSCISIYFCKFCMKNLLKENEKQLKDLTTEETTQYSKAA